MFPYIRVKTIKTIKIRWSLKSDGLFSVASARACIDRSLLPSSDTPTTWLAFLPGKVNIFLWRLIRDRLPHRLNLSSRGLAIQSISCGFCNQGVESLDHLFFSCSYAREVWRAVFIWVDRPFHGFSSWQEILSWIDSLNGNVASKDCVFAIVVATLWMLWRLRNCLVFNDKSVKKCAVVDSIKFFSFAWLKFRAKRCVNGNDWLLSPL
ncbi:uncharacterized protein [Rutidosis leptorrhynchoides]|uniref:uncharacterized protein n=1 Tax=Rutidosis leptorrhynchoides TaxID=125765 RepID=UPI003A99DCDA